MLIFSIPLITWTHIPLFGKLSVQVWGLFVSLGFICGLMASLWFAKKKNLKTDHIYAIVLWVMIGSFIGARIFYLFEAQRYFIMYPVEVFKVWNGGFSIIGGFLGSIMATLLYCRKEKIRFWDYSDSLIFGLPLGLCIGRMGCALIHDHPGRICNTLICVDFGGVLRHEPAYYLSINGLLMFIAFLALDRYLRNTKKGFFVAAFLIWYGTARFFLDFTRDPSVDVRFLSLTIAQYFSIMMLIGGIIIARKQKIITPPK